MKFLAPLTLLFMLTFSVINGQVGINTTTPNASSILDISASDKGLLIPRIALIGLNDTTTILNPVESLLVYNTTSNSEITPGFYFWNGSQWTEFSSNASGGGSSDPHKWTLQGNELTANDFIGSTNWSALTFKVNNQKIASFHPNGGLLLGLGAASNVNNAIAIGTNASATTNESIALGYSTIASGYRSTAIGYNAQATTNNYSLALGANAVASGLNSAVFGNSSTASGQNATAVGYGANATNANTIILGNSISDITNWNATKVGIGTNTPSEKLEVKGNVKIDGILKITDGTQGNGKVLTSDANGNASWQEVSGEQKIFAEMNANSTSSLSQYNPINFGNTVITQGINTSSNGFQVVQSGVYRVTYAISVSKANGSDTNVKFYLAKGWGSSNAVQGSAGYGFVGNGDTTTITVTKYVQLNAYDQLYVFSDASNNAISILPDGTYFNIELVD
ncbi:hypothetical protein [Constantimarinum furrinae]|uniref:Trimeric autotransporter adhesin YadA-like head domain-containing protein n=1 Tax=Constantimarinum furrinae TaxID=2562285 RepID=A0A7G8PXI0_9FLAO|nr:hypothetical protein [Constantimarinum furrinae]QNJ99046.1 hypothetical protein ALE3EI_2510 [Constantimarinum furrinae]